MGAGVVVGLVGGMVVDDSWPQSLEEGAGGVVGLFGAVAVDDAFGLQ